MLYIVFFMFWRTTRKKNMLNLPGERWYEAYSIKAAHWMGREIHRNNGKSWQPKSKITAEMFWVSEVVLWTNACSRTSWKLANETFFIPVLLNKICTRAKLWGNNWSNSCLWVFFDKEWGERFIRLLRYGSGTISNNEHR